jgi:hypothetical protein
VPACMTTWQGQTGIVAAMCTHIPSLSHSTKSWLSLFLIISLGIGILSIKLRKFLMNISLGCCTFSTRVGSSFQT